MAEVELRNVRQFFRRSGGALVEAVADVSLVIRSHEFVCLIGPSGCGKTTLLQLVAGLHAAQASGQISVDGAAIAGPSPERGLVFQRDSVFPWMRTIDNVSYGLKCRGVEKAKASRDRAPIPQRGGAWPTSSAPGRANSPAAC